MQWFDHTALAPVGAHADEEHFDVLTVEELDIQKMADHIVQERCLHLEVVDLFISWTLDGIHTWADEDQVMTWHQVIEAALERWREYTIPSHYTITILEGADPAPEDDYHGDPYPLGGLPLALPPEVDRALTGNGQRLVVHPGAPRPDDHKRPEVVRQITLSARYVQD